MTRDEKVAEAQRLRAEGLSYERIGQRLGVTQTAVWKWLNPERARANARRENARPETKRRKRAWDATKGRAACPKCGGPLGVNSKHRNRQMCRSCVDADAIRKRGLIVEGYRAGLTAYEIEAATGIPCLTVRNEACRLREQGIPVPYAPTGARAHRAAREEAAA